MGRRTVRKSCTQSLFVSDVGHPCQRNDVGVKRLPFFNPTMRPPTPPPHFKFRVEKGGWASLNSAGRAQAGPPGDREAVS